MTRAPGRTTERKPLTKLQRAKLWADHKGLCYLCSLPIEPTKPFTDEHVIPLGLGGTNDPSNRRPVHMHCGKQKTVEEDMPRINKAKAMQTVLVGKDPDAKPSIQSAGFKSTDKSQKVSRLSPPSKFDGLPHANLFRRYRSVP